MQTTLSLKIGITGQAGFVGTHLYNVLGLQSDIFLRVPFEDAFFQNHEDLCSFVKKCDVIIHLAALNRHPDPTVLYDTNIRLVVQLIDAMEAAKVSPHVLFSSSTQEDLENDYGKSKRDGRILFEQWATRNNASFTSMVVPNVYGPFGLPNYNSFIATFCHKLTHGETPQIIQDSDVRLIYVGKLCDYFLKKIIDVHGYKKSTIDKFLVPFDFQKKVSNLLALLNNFKTQYFDYGIIPRLEDENEVNLFNTFRSYIDINAFFPVKLIPHADPRGVFVETLKLGIGGQISFSTTIPGITRGNHYHTRKIERFIVIKGKAIIELREIGSNEKISLYLDGAEPAYVDMPIWYTHNITNIGEDELLTQFWINEWYNHDDPDTYLEKV